MDTYSVHWENARRELHKNATSYIEQLLEATSHQKQLYSHLPSIPKTIQIRRTIDAGDTAREVRANS